MNWQTGFPTKEGEYLCVTEYNGRQMYRLLNFSKDLYSVDKYDFYELASKHIAGFYEYDTEWGYYKVDNVMAWCKIYPYRKEG